MLSKSRPQDLPVASAYVVTTDTVERKKAYNRSLGGGEHHFFGAGILIGILVLLYRIGLTFKG